VVINLRKIIMNLNEIALISSLAISGISCSIFSPANAADIVPVNFNGSVYYVTTTVGNPVFPNFNIANTPWYQNVSIATYFAQAVGETFGLPNTNSPEGPAGAYFAFDIRTAVGPGEKPYILAAAILENGRVSNNFGLFTYFPSPEHPGPPNPFLPYTFAEITTLPEPLNILGAMAGLAFFATVSTAIKKKKA
jgi:hypothetical protein